MAWPNYDDGDAASTVPTVAYTQALLVPSPLVYGPSGQSYTLVTLASGLPVQPQTDSVWAVTVESLPLPAGAATAANQVDEIALLTSIGTLLEGPLVVADGGGSLTVDGPLTDTQLRASAVPVSAASLPLPSGAATAANQDTTNVSLASIDAKLVSLATGHGTAAAAVRVELPTDGTGVVGLTAGTAVVGKVGIDQTTPGTTDSVTVKSTAYTSQPTVTRPANTTPYSAGDVVGGAITFSSAGPSGGHLLVTTADLRIDVTAVPSGMTSFRLYLYDVTPPSAIADNGAWDLPSGDRSAYLGYLDLGTVADLGSTLYTQATNPGLQVKLASASTTLFAYLVTTAGYTPAANSEVYTPRLRGVAV